MESVTQNISSPLAAFHFVFVWCQAAVLYPCPPFPAICLQANLFVPKDLFLALQSLE